MLSLQKHLNKDKICNTFVDNFLNNINYTAIEEFSLIDEAWIQKTLRDHGFKIKCDGLNIFPSNTSDLKKITYQL